MIQKPPPLRPHKSLKNSYTSIKYQKTGNHGFWPGYVKIKISAVKLLRAPGRARLKTTLWPAGIPSFPESATIEREHTVYSPSRVIAARCFMPPRCGATPSGCGADTQQPGRCAHDAIRFRRLGQAMANMRRALRNTSEPEGSSANARPGVRCMGLTTAARPEMADTCWLFKANDASL